jgi:hypothetical protein
MRVWIAMGVLLILLFAFASQAVADEVTVTMADKYGYATVTVDLPDGLVPFTAETNFMSTIGFVRWLTWWEYQQWFPRRPELPITISVATVGSS